MLKHHLKIGMMLYKFRRLQNTQFNELSPKRITCKNTLNDVGTVKAVHAVGSDDGSLLMQDFAFWIHVEMPVKIDSISNARSSADINYHRDNLCMSNSLRIWSKRTDIRSHRMFRHSW